MRSLFFTGTQFGDEGKGRIVDLICSLFHTIGVRFQGGANAGHTICFQGKKYVVHQLPSSCLSPGSISIIGNGCVVDPCALLEEISDLRRMGINLSPQNVLISERAHIVTPYHIARDVLRCKDEFGTTSKGIGPCYESKYRREGLRFLDLFSLVLNRDEIEKRLRVTDEEREYVDNNLSWEKFRVSVLSVLSYVKDIRPVLLKAVNEGTWQIVFEGAQGHGLDIDHGDYPNISTSNSSIGGAFTGTGVFIPFKYRVGILKAYSTRVGVGNFVMGEVFPFEKELQEKGQEFGATTGRPRSCGWLDCDQIRDSIIASGLNSLVLTKLDILSGFPYVGMNVGYHDNNPVIKTMEGWDEDISGITDFDSLPQSCKAFIQELETQVRVPVGLISTGPNREDFILRDKGLMGKP